MPATAEGRSAVIRITAIGNRALDQADVVGYQVDAAVAIVAGFAGAGGVDFQVEYRSWLALAMGGGDNCCGKTVLPFAQRSIGGEGPLATGINGCSTDQYALVVNVDLGAGSRLAAQGRRGVVGDAAVL